jgi:hypothetical protein
MQEDHIKECLERAAKYLVYDLPAEKVLIGTECKFVRLQSCRILMKNRYPLSRAIRQRIDCGAIELSMQLPQLFV